jgi:hypothetical protein
LGRVYLTCLSASNSLANPPLQVFGIGARSQLAGLTHGDTATGFFTEFASNNKVFSDIKPGLQADRKS